MTNALSQAVLECENSRYLGSGARSQENHSLGFRPAFMDAETGIVYASCFSDGRPAPFHLLDGLPDEVVLARNPSGRVESVKQSMVSGFVLEQRFFTRDEAASWINRQSMH
jgi:hypothetical protein